MKRARVLREGEPMQTRAEVVREAGEAIRRVNNPHGNASYHPSVAEYEHEGSRHTSKDR